MRPKSLLTKAPTPVVTAMPAPPSPPCPLLDGAFPPAPPTPPVMLPGRLDLSIIRCQNNENLSLIYRHILSSNSTNPRPTQRLQTACPYQRD